ALFHAASPRSSPAAIGGVVRDGAGPVVGARVRFQGGAFSTLTDASGRFQLPPAPGARRLTAWKEGYLIAGVRATGRRILQLAPLPREDDEAYEWVDPTPRAGDEQRCGNCHAHLHGEWAGGGHARSAVG